MLKMVIQNRKSLIRILILILGLALSEAKHLDFEKSIIGGGNAPPNEAKFQVQVHMNYIRKHNYFVYHWESEESSAFCGGSLLDPTTVLTAAHCVKLFAKNYFIKIRYGTHQLDSSQFEDIRATEIRIHPGYDEVINDIAIVKLERPVSLNSDCFVDIERRELPPNGRTTIYGWGIAYTIPFEGLQPKNLQKGTLFALSNRHCQDLLNAIEEPKFPRDAADKVICATNVKATACQGDSGGPMIFDYDHKLAGITSMVQDGCKKNGLNIYTKVSYYWDWIQNNRY